MNRAAALTLVRREIELAEACLPECGCADCQDYPGKGELEVWRELEAELLKKVGKQ